MTSKSDTPTSADRLAYRVREAAQVLAISRSRFYQLVAEGEIRVLKAGARTLVRHSELVAYLDRLEENAAAEHGMRPRRACRR
uniref:DNA binding domain protein, excisionase family n=1 Tax=Caulobacter sp. (strain K31) TaxID=366602 RepID=B0T6I6_CAUSK